MTGLQTQYAFTLPKGYVDDVGVLHRHGTMRMATARDEIEPLRSRDIDGPDDPYLTVLVLARVIVELGSVDEITTDVVESLFAADLAFLQDLYGIINFGDPADVAALQATVADDRLDRADAADDPITDSIDDADDLADAEPAPTAGRPASRRARATVEEVTSTATT